MLTSPSSSTQQLGNALEALRYLVEPVDLANGEGWLCVEAPGCVWEHQP